MRKLEILSQIPKKESLGRVAVLKDRVSSCSSSVRGSLNKEVTKSLKNLLVLWQFYPEDLSICRCLRLCAIVTNGMIASWPVG